MKRKSIVLFLMFLLLAASSLTAFAVPYYSYEYNDYDESVAAPVGYVPSAAVTGVSLGLEQNFSGINDMYYDNNGTVYLLDSGNNRILTLDSDFKLKKAYENFKDAQGNAVAFSEAQGIAADSAGRMYVADTKANRVLIIGQDCVVEKIITRPDKALNNTGASFNAGKVILDKDGRLYVSATNINLGLFVFSPEGEFLQFWGANEVPTTAQAMLDYMRKRFMTNEQRAIFTLATPVTVTGFDFSQDGFLYTVSPYKNEGDVAVPGLIRKLNFKGQDILDPELVFGDLEWDRKQSLSKRTAFVDVAVDELGFVNLLDYNRGRVFQYTDSAQLVSVFGARGDMTGGLEAPSSLIAVGEKIYVADTKKNVIYEYSPTVYVQNVRSAVRKMNAYDLEGSLQEWRTIVSKNTNSLYAYKGMGRVYEAQGHYKEAMRYYKLAYAREDYSKSFQQYRMQWLEQYYYIVLILAAAAIALLIVATRMVARNSKAAEGQPYSRLESKYLFPVYTLFHPTDGFDQFKSRNIQSMRLSALIVFFWVAAVTVQFFCTGPAFAKYRPTDYNLWINLLQTAGLFLLFAVSNWAVCTLMDGKGRLTAIVAAAAYAMIPYIASLFVNTGLSNILAQDEYVFMGIVSAVGILWSLMLLVCGMYAIHQYSFLKTIFSLVFTVVGIFIIIFLGMLFFGLLQQTWAFVVSVYREAMLRI